MGINDGRLVAATETLSSSHDYSQTEIKRVNKEKTNIYLQQLLMIYQ